MNEQLKQLAELIADHHTKKQLADEARETFEAEFAAVLTAEKQAYLKLEALKQKIRDDRMQHFRDTSEKPAEHGLTLVMLDAVQIDNEQAAIAFCAQYAPQLLMLRGKEILKEWAAKHLALIKTGENQWTTIYETGQNRAVACPFRVVRQPSIRISEREIFSQFDQERWEENHE